MPGGSRQWQERSKGGVMDEGQRTPDGYHECPLAQSGCETSRYVWSGNGRHYCNQVACVHSWAARMELLFRAEPPEEVS